ncbi:MAG: hypothetical protein GY791_07995 [Alphaproteobacteria bacterium]|nr:hypothetical protein [Alphaproteobacteria bacterium]
MPRLTGVILSLAVMSLVGGCADLVWEKPGVSQAQTQAAIDECSQHANNEAWRDQWIDNWPPPFYDSSYMPPYYGVGAVPFWHGGPDAFEQEEDLTRFCMHSRGYRLNAVRS